MNEIEKEGKYYKNITKKSGLNQGILPKMPKVKKWQKTF